MSLYSLREGKRGLVIYPATKGQKQEVFRYFKYVFGRFFEEHLQLWWNRNEN